MQEFKKSKIEEIHSIKEIGIENVFDIENEEKDFVLDEPNFLADGFLVHNCTRHAGGIILLDRPIYELIPVERVNDELITAFPESGGEAVLDEIGIIKFDVLAISILSVIEKAIENIEEKLFLIIDDDGVEKVVPESYL